VAIDDTIKVTWVAPDNGGSPITGYTVVFRHSDGVTVSTQLDHCDASQSAIFTVTECAVPAAVLNAAPFSLPWGTEVFAQVSAYNLYGESSLSTFGGGGIIVRVPDAPINLAENYSDRSPTTLGFTWQDGSENGGLQVEDYRLSFAETGGVFSVVASGIVT
jgi:hypothetical protein